MRVRSSARARLGGGPAHERLLLANLATELFKNKRITTTETKAKRLAPLAERLVTFAKRGDLHARRRVMTIIRDKNAVEDLFSKVAPLLADRQHGYTRITRIGYRQTDNTQMVVIELILEPEGDKGARRSGAAPAQATQPHGDDLRAKWATLAEFKASTRAELDLVASRLDLRIRGYNREGQYVLASRSLRPFPDLPVLLQVVRQQSSTDKKTFVVGLSWLGEEPSFVKALGSDVRSAIARTLDDSGGSGDDKADPA